MIPIQFVIMQMQAITNARKEKKERKQRRLTRERVGSSKGSSNCLDNGKGKKRAQDARFRADDEQASNEASESEKGSDDQATEMGPGRDLQRDMYKRFDGSALMAIGGFFLALHYPTSSDYCRL